MENLFRNIFERLIPVKSGIRFFSNLKTFFVYSKFVSVHFFDSKSKKRNFIQETQHLTTATRSKQAKQTKRQ